MPDPTKQQLSSLSEQQWTELYNRLLLFAVKRYGWLKELSGWDVHDVVQQAIIDVLQGDVRPPPRDPQAGNTSQAVDVFPFLCNVIKSNVSDLRKSERAKSRTEIHELDLDIERLLQEPDASDKDLQKVRAAFLSNQNSENIALYHELSERVHKAVADDQELTNVIDLLLYMPDSRPREIAEQLGLSIQQIYPILKRLRRLLTTMQEEAING
jgi:RNA polymerase sigma factor (sigma-70 family)